MLIDTHCHLNDREAFPDPELAIEEARKAGVERLIVVGVDPDSGRRALALAESFEGVFAVVGRHPNYAADFAGPEELEGMLGHPKVVAVGEIGLDFHWHYASREQQEAALRVQLDLADKVGLPVVFHCRDAYPELLDVLESRKRLPYLFHCFSGDRKAAERAIALDCYFGVDGPITYKKSHELREIVGSLPKDRIVVETDSPYLSPEPCRGKPNRPANVAIVNAALASTLGISVEECGALTTANAVRFFRL